MFKNFIIITGHYGSGKTNIAVNLAMTLRQSNKNVTIVDMDIVNPYFRMADSKILLERMGIKCIIPEFANTNVDMPALPAEIYSTFNQDGYVIYDVGGDDNGATALSVYKEYFDKCEYDMFCVCNMYRPLTADPLDAVALLRDIEKKSRLKCTGIINNSNIGVETDEKILFNSFEYISEVCRISGLPLIFHSTNLNFFKMQNVTKNIWRLKN
ncbi:MAG: P-loop NTPase [Oscillospiraceae bacterium]|nr:P-loop NTPase [Oscillospiraceae bacterium]